MDAVPSKIIAFSTVRRKGNHQLIYTAMEPVDSEDLNEPKNTWDYRVTN